MNEQLKSITTLFQPANVAGVGKPNIMQYYKANYYSSVVNVVETNLLSWIQTEHTAINSDLKTGLRCCTVTVTS